MWTCPKCAEQIEGQFDSCWKCASQPELIRPPRMLTLRWFNYLFAFLVAYLVPLFSVWCYVALVVSWGRHRLRVVEGVDNFSEGAFWLWMLVPGAISFLVLLPFLRYDFARRAVGICLGGFWIYLMYSNL